MSSAEKCGENAATERSGRACKEFDDRPFPTEQCKKCKYWRAISSVYPFGYRACHYTFDTGRAKKSNPPECDVFMAITGGKQLSCEKVTGGVKI